MNGLSAVLLAVFLLCAVMGFLRGFLKSVMSIAFFALVIVSTAALTPRVGQVIRGSRNVSSFFREKCDEILAGSVDLTQNPVVEGNSGLLQDVSEMLEGSAISREVRSEVTEKVTDVLCTVTAAAVTFVLSLIAWIVIQAILNHLLRIGAGGAVNRVLGLLFGMATGLLIVWTALAVIGMLSFTGIGSGLQREVSGSAALTALSANNPVYRLMIRMIGNALAGLLTA